MDYHQLEVWKKSMLLVKEIYLLTREFPKEETYGLISQINRAAVSIPVNIAEGLGRQYKKETVQFLYIARGSVYELDTLLRIAILNELLIASKFERISSSIYEVMKLINGFIRYFQKSPMQ